MEPLRRQFALMLASLTAAPGLGWAHRELRTHTKINWLDFASTLHITHTFHMHDAATALASAGIIETPDLLSLISRAKLALYTEEHFGLKTLEGETIALELLGADFEGKSVYVFQQAQLDFTPTGLSIDCRILHDLVPGQVNDIDVNLGGEVRSARFKNGDEAKIILA